MRLLALALAITAALALPSTASAASPRPDTDCASIARHHSGLEVEYQWGTSTGCHGGTVYRARHKAALRDLSWGAFPDMVKTDVCDKGFYAAKGKVVFVAKHKHQVKRFRKTYVHRYHKHFGPVTPIKAMPSYQPQYWC